MPTDPSRVQAALDYAAHVAPLPKKRRRVRTDFKPTVFSPQAIRGALYWENERLRRWRKAGRLTADGVLRVGAAPLKPYKLQDVARLLPHLPALDRLAALVDLNGVVEANFMGNPEHEYIRKVVEAIADERVARALQGRDETTSIRALIRAEVGAIFGELHAGLGQKVTPQLGGTASRGQRKCSKCGLLGHMRTTCRATGPAAPDKWACIPCSDKAGRSLSNPVTHPTPSETFHQDDPAFATGDPA